MTVKLQRKEGRGGGGEGEKNNRLWNFLNKREAENTSVTDGQSWADQLTSEWHGFLWREGFAAHWRGNRVQWGCEAWKRLLRKLLLLGLPWWMGAQGWKHLTKKHLSWRLQLLVHAWCLVLYLSVSKGTFPKNSTVVDWKIGSCIALLLGYGQEHKVMPRGFLLDEREGWRIGKQRVRHRRGPTCGFLGWGHIGCQLTCITKNQLSSQA